VAADATNLANSLKTAWTTNFAPLCHPQVSLTSVVVTDLSSPTGGQGTSTGAVVGTRAGTTLTSNDCFLVDFKINRRYRGGKPRQYWPFGIQTDILDPQHWTTTFVTAVTNAHNAMGAAAISLTWSGGQIANSINISWYQGFTVVTNPVTGRARNVPKLRTTPLTDQVTASTFSQRIATQRRRQHFSQ